jgi:citrate synthase
MRAVAAVLAKSARPLPVNVDGALAAVLVDMSFEPAVAKIAFLLGRCAGIAAHVLEELTRERPMRIEVPFVYDGS